MLTLLDFQNAILDLFEDNRIPVQDAKLQTLGMGMEETNPWIESIRERAEAEKVDHKTASAQITRDLRQLGGIQRQIERANQELALVEMTAIQKKQAAIITLLNLQTAGFTEKQIIELTAVVNTWNARSGIAGSSHVGNNGN